MKILKILSKWILMLGTLFFTLFGLFLGIEYYKGNSYIDYLKANNESVRLTDKFTFEICEQDIAQKSLILVGEIHGFEEPIKFDVDLFQHLTTNYNVQSYLLEMDYSQAYFMNKFNETNDQDLLKKILPNWVVSAGRKNQDYLNKYIQLQKLFESQPFRYYGINNISDVALLIKHINELAGEELIKPYQSASDSTLIIEAKSALELLSNKADSVTQLAEVAWDIDHLLKNVNYWLGNTYREEVLTNNLIDMYNHFQLKEKKVYGFFGLGHTLMNKFASGYAPMAYRIRELDPWFENKILSMNFVFCDSYMVMPSKSLPGILQDKGAYTRLPVTYDNIWLSYLYGIKDLKRVTEKNTKTIFKINSDNSPYNNSNRLFSMFKILPVGQVINAGEGLNTIDFAQYMIFVRNSDWAEPIQN